MKRKIREILSKFRNHEGYTMNQAENELFHLLSNSENNLYDTLADINDLYETEIPNIWRKNNEINDCFDTIYVLTKLGFCVKHTVNPLKRNNGIINWLFPKTKKTKLKHK